MSRCFVLYEGVSIGRIDFLPVVGGYSLYKIEFYKPSEYEYASDDDFFYQFEFWFATGKIINVNALVDQAKINKWKKIEEKRQWRKENPTKLVLNKRTGEMVHKSRTKLTTSWKGELQRLIEEEKKKILVEIN
jgi:hypothetical protein